MGGGGGFVPPLDPLKNNWLVHTALKPEFGDTTTGFPAT